VSVTTGPGGTSTGIIDHACCAADDHHMAMHAHLPLTDVACDEVAMRFRALSEPMRLKILRRLFRSEASVGEILDEVGGTQANVSKHLAVLHGSALVDRRKDGTRTVYRIADPTLLKICSIVCEGVERGARDKADAILGRPRRGGRR
jgi:DNA-binding transcriptional ArsR family regulator